MNIEIEQLINLLLAEMPFSLNVMITLVLIGYFVLPTTSAAFLLIAIFDCRLLTEVFNYRKPRRKENVHKTLLSAFLFFLISIGIIYQTSRYYISTSFTPYLIGETDEKLAKDYDVLPLSIVGEIVKMSDESQQKIRECNTPYKVNDKYVMPRTFDLMQCLGLK